MEQVIKEEALQWIIKKICVKQYDLEGNFIKEYPSMKEAERQTGISTGSISRVCSQQRKSAGGYIWTKEM